MGDSCDGIGKAFFPESDAAGANVEKNSLLQSGEFQKDFIFYFVIFEIVIISAAG